MLASYFVIFLRIKLFQFRFRFQIRIFFPITDLKFWLSVKFYPFIWNIKQKRLLECLHIILLYCCYSLRGVKIIILLKTLVINDDIQIYIYMDIEVRLIVEIYKNILYMYRKHVVKYKMKKMSLYLVFFLTSLYRDRNGNS